MISDLATFSVDELVEKGVLDRPMDGNHGAIHPKATDFKTHGFPFVMASDLHNGRVNYEQCAFIDEETRKKLQKGFARQGDVLLSHKATIGRTALVDDTFDEIVLTPQVTYYRVKDPKVLNNQYLKYYFDSSVFQALLKQWAGDGSTRSYIGITAQGKLPIVVPPIKQQDYLVRVLSVIDKKIELNRVMNKTLEDMGQALFKQYFIDNPEREGWKKKPLDEVADFLNGLASQKYPPKKSGETLPVIKIREMSAGITQVSDKVSVEFPKEYIVENGDFLFAWSGTLMTKLWTGGRGALNQHIFKVTSKTYPKWFYYHWTNHYLQHFVAIAKSKAVTMGHIKRSHISEAFVSVPPSDFIAEVNLLFQSNLERQIKNAVENSTLVLIRDSLLPKLMSGDIEL